MAAPRFETEKFNGKNDFGLWRMKMKAILVQQGVADALKIEKDADPDAKKDQKKESMMEKAHSAIILCLADNVLHEVSKETTAAGVWAKLESLYLTKSLANRLYMKQRLYSYSFHEDRGIVEQLEEFNKAVDDLENIEVSLDDEDKAIMLLNALPRSFDQLRDAMLYGRENSITLGEVQSALKAKELQKSSQKGQDLVAESLIVKKFKGNKGFKKKFEGNKSHQPAKDSSDQRETRSCHWCKKPGHLKRDCYAWKKKQALEGNKPHNSSDCIEEVEVAEILNIMESDNKHSWIMDSGCSFHMCPSKEWFEELDETAGSVLLGNNYTCKIRGIGKVRMEMDDGSIKILSEVRYIPEIKRNLISLGMLESRGCSFKSSDGKLMVIKGSQTVMQAHRRNSLYYLNARVISGSANLVETNNLRLWHMRLAHLGENGMKELIKQKLIPIDDKQHLETCEECILGKGKRQPFPRGKHTSLAPLDYAHSDLWGPAPVTTMGGGRYFMSIIDDYSRKVWIYVLKDKSEAFGKFRIWCTEVESEKVTKLKCLRTDNGMEFLSHDFDRYCKEKGIRRHRTVPGTPQQNGTAERLNRTILERVRCMIFSSGVPKVMWGEAVTTAAYLINKSPSSSIEFNTPDQKWYGSSGDYSRLRVFGCRAYAHIKQGKLEARALKCVMLGYQTGVKGYRLWCLESGNKKIVISRDVVFNENEMPFKMEKDRSVGTDPGGTRIEVEHQGDDLDKIESGSQIGGADAVPTDESLKNYQLARDRVRRTITPPARYSDADMVYYALMVADEVDSSEPANYKEAVSCAEKEQWIAAMKEEIESLLKNKTWILVTRPVIKKIVSCKWIFKKKIEAADGDKVRFKARLVARGFTQEEGVDYNEVYSPVVKHSSIRVLMAVVANKDWELHQLDVKTAFLHGELEETIYMYQPEGFIVDGDEDKVCMLKKSLYGLKQSSRQWYKRFDDHMMQTGYIRSDYDHCVYIKRRNGVAVGYLLLYVDDMLVAGIDKDEVQRMKDDLQTCFDMKDLGETRRILGIDIFRNREKKQIWLSQDSYVRRLLKRFQADKGKQAMTPLAQHFRLSKEQSPKTEEERKEMQMIPYANIVGSIMYMMVCTRPDVAHAISVTSRYMADHGREHWLALKWILKYLKGAGNFGILYDGMKSADGEALVGYCDSDFAANIDSRKSQSGYIFTLYGSAVSWKSSLQHVVSLSTTEAEYVALTEAVKESFWLKGIAADFGIKQSAVTVYCDSSSALCLARHQVFHERSKHIDVKLHFIRDEIEKERVKVEKIQTEHNPADMLTKALPASKFRHCMELLNMRGQEF